MKVNILLALKLEVPLSMHLYYKQYLSYPISYS